MYVNVLFKKGNELETFALVFESTISVQKRKKKVDFLVPQILIVVSTLSQPHLSGDKDFAYQIY